MSGSIIAFPRHATLAPRADAGVTASLRLFVEAALREWRLRHDMRRLEELDGATLHDIGLTRGGIEGAVRHGRPRRSAPDAGLPAIGERRLMPTSWTEWR